MNAQKRSQELKNEKTIRALLKLPHNKKCFACTSKTTPQYVCTKYNTFVCTTCSGVHREFGHRVKSVSYTKFSTEEVNELKANGNEAAEAKWLAAWSPKQLPIPDEGNRPGIKKFIDQVFVQERFTAKEGEVVPTPRANQGKIDQPPESKSDFSSTSSTFAATFPESNFTAPFASEPVKGTTGYNSWQTFEDSFPTSTANTPPTQPAKPAENVQTSTWEAFGDDSTTAGVTAAPSGALNTTTADPFAPSPSTVPAETPSTSEWESFGTPEKVQTKKEDEEVKQEKEVRKELPMDLFTLDEPQSSTTTQVPQQQLYMQPQANAGFAQQQNPSNMRPYAQPVMMQAAHQLAQQPGQQAWNMNPNVNTVHPGMPPQNYYQNMQAQQQTLQQQQTRRDSGQGFGQMPGAAFTQGMPPMPQAQQAGSFPQNPIQNWNQPTGMQHNVHPNFQQPMTFAPNAYQQPQTAAMPTMNNWASSPPVNSHSIPPGPPSNQQGSSFTGNPFA